VVAITAQSLEKCRLVSPIEVDASDVTVTKLSSGEVSVVAVDDGVVCPPNHYRRPIAGGERDYAQMILVEISETQSRAGPQGHHRRLIHAVGSDDLGSLDDRALKHGTRTPLDQVCLNTYLLHEACYSVYETLARQC
jgi:hypothetical protein